MPDEWGDDEFDDQVRDARDKADLPPSKGTLTTKGIKDNRYIYLQWREGDSIKSQYVAPVSPSNSNGE